MAAATWPASLPQDLRLDDLELIFPNGSVRGSDETLLVQQRWRFNASVTPVEGTIIIPSADYTTLFDFWKDTLGHGALPFNWEHPITGVTVEMRFLPKSPPVIEGIGQGKCLVSLALEILP